MKKIILISVITVSGSLALHAQQSAAPMPAPNGQKVKVMTTEEANRLNGTAQPTINGIPYSQYKAQQAAAKNNQQAPTLVTAPGGGVKLATADENNAVIASQKTATAAPAVKPVQNNAVPTAPATLVTPPVVNIAVDAQQAVPAESPAKLGRPEELKAQPVQTEKPKGQQ